MHVINAVRCSKARIINFVRRCIFLYKHFSQVIDQIRSTVTDGVTIGRPCCAVHDCKGPLPTVKHRYCQNHGDLAKICTVVSCDAKAEPGFRTCAAAEHRKLEVYHHQKGKAMFQLKYRLQRLKVSQTHDSLVTTHSLSQSRLINEEKYVTQKEINPEHLQPPQAQATSEDVNSLSESVLEGSGADDDEDVLLDENGVSSLGFGQDEAAFLNICDGKPDTGNRTIKARFGRARTHNEQLCVGSCGVILGRATFYGSEAPNGVRVCFYSTIYSHTLSLRIHRRFG
jgi:hypothetical protein